MRRTLAVLVGTTAVLAAGCAAPGASGGGDGYRCSGELFPPSVLEDGATAEALEHAQMLQGAEVLAIDPAQWSVLREAEDGGGAALLRALDEPEDLGAGDVRTHELVVIEEVDGSAPRSWMLSQHSTCALTLDVDGVATATLDPENPPDPEAAELSLLVTEQACNSGQDAEGRVRTERLEQTERTVGVVVVVDPLPGNHNCPDNPPTPYVVELDEPLGERTPLDVSVAPPRELTLPTRAAP